MSLKFGRRTSDISPPQPDQAWKALTLTNEWIRHADTKTGVTFAFIGVTGGALISLSKGRTEWSLLSSIVAGTATVLLLAAVFFAAKVLFARTQHPRKKKEKLAEKDVELNSLFYGHIAKHDELKYQDVLVSLTSDVDQLTRQIAAQVHVNSCIATTKFTFVNRAIATEIAAAILTAAFAALTTWGI